MTGSHLSVSEYRSFFKLVEQPVVLSNPPTAFAHETLLVSTEVYLQVALLCRPVVAVWALEGLLARVCAHVKGKDAVKAETLPTQRAGVLPVLAVVVLGRSHLGDDALISDSQELGQLDSPIHAAQNPRIHDLIGQKRHMASNWMGGWGNEAFLSGTGWCYSTVVRSVCVGQSKG